MTKSLPSFTIVRNTSMVVMLMGLTIIKGFSQQNIQFTQYMFNGHVINPAYAGADEALSLTFVQRSQWSAIEGAPSTQTLTGHTLFNNKHVGLGLTLVNDKIGVHKNFTALTSYAYHLSVSHKAQVSLGVQGGLKSMRSDYGSLNASNDPRVADASISKTYPDLGFGIYYRSPTIHAGLSVPQIIQEKYALNDSLSINISKTNILFFSKYRIPLNENLEVEPGILLKYFAGVPLSFDLNANLIYRQVFVTGLSYRNKESFDFLLKAKVSEQLQIGYAYDYPINAVSRIGNGSHELMINYQFRYTQRNVTSPR
ncbi:PorP/SprF family type IX secretion system membrane protein [Chryseosolibacter indicus]|uniref:Type IX secretion system membrane protein PorP/SprF n=1 Tax=Chryseosolibacter indicus TaxID=2782351 RepID=A0ABS5VKG9_9BACT|nr:type IX secretion system membrane protein PorP/SprF [Chryseosolibacter indicus]MBT1701937.1 type IX secretion system membrane protein PorP/SprF [Chryseosolibacter indicus]